jgi:hypothetical protein
MLPPPFLCHVWCTFFRFPRTSSVSKLEFMHSVFGIEISALANSATTVYNKDGLHIYN